jgi:hypothetical protein
MYLRISQCKIACDLFAFLARSHLGKYWRRIERAEVDLSGTAQLTIDDCVSPDMVHGVALINHKASFAYDNSDFPFIIKTAGEFWMRIDVFSGRNDTGAPLCEYHRMRC